MNKIGEDYDVIIVGGGISGLSLASVLGKGNKVCIIEKEKLGNTTKSWASFRDLIRKEKLQDCIINNKINTLEFRHFLGAKWIFNDKYCQLDEGKVLREFVNRCKDENVKFIEKQEIDNYKKNKKEVKFKVNKRIIKGKLFIDCTGGDSPFIKKLNLLDNYSSYPIYGLSVKNVDVDHTRFVWEIMKTPRFKDLMIGGIMPYSDESAQVHVFPYLKDKKIKYSLLKKYLFDYFKYHPGLKKNEIIKETYGTIMMGLLKKNALDNVFFFGDSALWTPRFIGTGFNQILRDYKGVGKELNKLISEDRLDEETLSQIKPVLQEKKSYHLLNCFEKIVFSLKEEPEELNDFLIKIRGTHKKFGKYLMRNDFNSKIFKKSLKKIHEHFSVSQLFEMLPKKDIIYLLEFLGEFLEDNLFESYQKKLKDI